MCVCPLYASILLIHLSSLHTLFQSHFYPQKAREYLYHQAPTQFQSKQHPESKSPYNSKHHTPPTTSTTMGTQKKHKHNRSTSSTDTQDQAPPTHLPSHSISTATAELSRIHSLAQPPDTSSSSSSDLPVSRRQRDRSSSDGYSHSHSHEHHHHRRRHAAKKALSSLLHESGMEGHFGLGVGVRRRGVGVDVGIGAGRSGGGEVGRGSEAGVAVGVRTRGTEVDVSTRAVRGISLGSKGSEVGLGVGVKTRGTEVGVSVGRGRGGFQSEKSADEGEKVEAALGATPVLQLAPAPGATLAPQVGGSAVAYSSSAAFSGHVRAGHGEYSMSAARESSLRIPQPTSIPRPHQVLFHQQTKTDGKLATPQLAKRYSCHICRFINEEIERCASCGHRLCIDCEWLMPIAPNDGTAQEFTIYEDEDGQDVGVWNTELEAQRAENVYTPSDFEQENYVDSSPPTLSLPPKLWARQSVLAKAHYTTPRSPTIHSPYTTPQSPSIPSPPPSPVDLSHLSASDYPEPLRLAPSPIRPPGPRSSRMVRDNPFVIADQMSTRQSPERGRGIGSEGGVRSRDGQASPRPREEDEEAGQRRMWQSKEDEGTAQGGMWQTNRVPLPGVGAEHHAAHRVSKDEKASAGRAAEPEKLDPVMSETLTSSVTKDGGDGVDEEGFDAHPISDVQKKTDMKRDGLESSNSGLHGGREGCHWEDRVRNGQGGCPLRSGFQHPPYYCGYSLPAQFYHGQAYQFQAGYAPAPFYPSFGYNPSVHQYPVSLQAGYAGCCGHVRSEIVQTVLWNQVPLSLYGGVSGSGCCGGSGTNGGDQFVATDNSCQCHFGQRGCVRVQGKRL